MAVGSTAFALYRLRLIQRRYRVIGYPIDYLIIADYLNTEINARARHFVIFEFQILLHGRCQFVHTHSTTQHKKSVSPSVKRNLTLRPMSTPSIQP